MFLLAVASLIGLLVMAVIIGLFYQCLVFVPRAKKGMMNKTYTFIFTFKRFFTVSSKPEFASVGVSKTVQG